MNTIALNLDWNFAGITALVVYQKYFPLGFHWKLQIPQMQANRCRQTVGNTNYRVTRGVQGKTVCFMTSYVSFVNANMLSIMSRFNCHHEQLVKYNATVVH